VVRERLQRGARATSSSFARLNLIADLISASYWANGVCLH
jgi:hypothetical protein